MTVQINGTNGIQFPDGVNLNIDKLFGTSGYQKLPGGLIIQWGYTTLLVTSASATYTLPVTFPNANLMSLVGSCAGNASGGGSDVGLTVTGRTTSSITIRNGYDSVMSDIAGWIAIGY